MLNDRKLYLQDALATFFDLVMGVITFFLGLRFVFRLFAANPEAPFVSWINGVSGNLMSPFAGIFSNIVLVNGGLIDVVAILSLIFYALLLYLIRVFVSSASRPTTPYLRRRESYL